MVNCVVTACTGNGEIEHIELDATPWFEQAKPSQLKRLASERQTGKDYGQEYVFYSGIQSDDIFGWMSTYMPTPDTNMILKFCDETDSSWVVDVNGGQVDAWLQQRKGTQAALGIVNKLLGEK